MKQENASWYYLSSVFGFPPVLIVLLSPRSISSCIRSSATVRPCKQNEVKAKLTDDLLSLLGFSLHNIMSEKGCDLFGVGY